MPNLSGHDVVSWLLRHYGQEVMNPGLDRIRRALSSLPNFSTAKIITIAGTNGKGETTLWLSKFLGKRSHCVWTSPHIERITERFRDETGEIAESELLELIEECHVDLRLRSIQLSFYEFLFFVFCTWASRKNPEFLLLEVGLGGRLDAVNALDAQLVLLPSISRDHQEILGGTFQNILKEKLGVLRPGSQLLSFLSLAYLRERTREATSALGASWLDLSEWKLLREDEFSRRNQLLAHAAFLYLQGTKITTEELRKFSFSEEFFEHRGDVIRGDSETIFFGSHNVDGLRKLIQFLKRGNYNFSRPPYNRVIAAFSKRSESDLLVMLRMLKGSGLGEIVITTFSHPKAASPEWMEKLAQKEGLGFVREFDIQNLKGNESGPTLVLGSYYFLGHIKSRLRGQ